MTKVIKHMFAAFFGFQRKMFEKVASGAMVPIKCGTDPTERDLYRTLVLRQAPEGQRKRRQIETVTLPREDWIIVPVDRLIDQDLWDAVCGVREQNKRKAKGKPKYKYMLSGHMCCARCDYAVKAKGAKDHGKRVYCYHVRWSYL